MRLTIAALAAIIVLIPHFAYSGERSICWYHAEFPPASIINGPLRNTGHDNYLEAQLKKELTDYSHTDHCANYGRILRQLATSNGCCVTLLKTPDREKFIEYSNPTMVYIGGGLIILKAREMLFKPLIDDEGYISISDIFEKSHLRMGVPNGRRYGGDVDKIVDEYKKTDRVLIHYKEDLLKSLLVKIQAEQPVDFTIGHAHELSWLVSHGEVKDEFTFIPIREMPRYILTYVGCTKNEWGRKVIKRINKILGQQLDPEYKRRYQSNLNPDLLDLHEEFVQEVFPNQEALASPVSSMPMKEKEQE